MAKAQQVLFDHQGPKGRMLTLVFNVLALVAVAVLAWVVLSALGRMGQLEASKWRPLIEADTWRYYVWPGIKGTLAAAALAVVLSIAFGVVFGLGRLSHVGWVRAVSSVIVEFLRAVPVLVMMIFLYFMLGSTEIVDRIAFWAVVLGLMLYNGSVIAELIRSGVHGLPRGQREAGLVVGLTESQTRHSILLPQALTAMLPSLVSQFVVILKDTALGYIITYGELLSAMRRLGAGEGNILQALLLAAALFIVINLALTTLASWLNGRLNDRRPRG